MRSDPHPCGHKVHEHKRQRPIANKGEQTGETKGENPKNKENTRSNVNTTMCIKLPSSCRQSGEHSQDVHSLWKSRQLGQREATVGTEPTPRETLAKPARMAQQYPRQDSGQRCARLLTHEDRQKVPQNTYSSKSRRWEPLSASTCASSAVHASVYAAVAGGLVATAVAIALAAAAVAAGGRQEKNLASGRGVHQRGRREGGEW